jgi:hypothetical protein
MDVVRLSKVNEVFRVLYDVKGRYILHELKDPKEAGMKLCRVQNVSTAKKATIGHNPFQAGQAGAIPYLSTHDGRTIRYPDPLIKKGDTVQIDIKTGKVCLSTQPPSPPSLPFPSSFPLFSSTKHVAAAFGAVRCGAARSVEAGSEVGAA